MVGSSDDDAVDIVAAEDFPVIQVFLAAGSELLFGRQTAGLGNITDGPDLGILGLGRQTQQVGGASADAETGDANTLVGAEDTAVGGGRPGGGGGQKPSASLTAPTPWRPPSRGACGGGWRSRAAWCTTRKSCSWTNPPPASTRPPAFRCGR